MKNVRNEQIMEGVKNMKQHCAILSTMQAIETSTTAWSKVSNIFKYFQITWAGCGEV